ncbi:MAG TPA: L,D-transpeptidase family protein [Marmoricola sp.]
MRTVAAAVALSGLLCSVVVAPALAAGAHTVRLDGVRVTLPPNGTQVVTVNHTHGYHARATLWLFGHGHWRRVLRTTHARIGYGGLVAPKRRHQGTGTTPLGTTRLLWAFGRHPAHASWKLRYRRIKKGDFWVEDNRSRFYNRYRNEAQGGFRPGLPASAVNGSERLSAYPEQYEYAIVTSYNYAHPVRHRGAGIFLHVNGGGATAGCVSAPRGFVRKLMARLDPAAHPVMAVGR